MENPKNTIFRKSKNIKKRLQKNTFVEDPEKNS